MAHILIIDDEPDIRDILKIILTAEGHTVDEAENGSTGIKLFRNRQYDLVITDIVMPEQDGFEVIKTLQQASPQTSIIAISGGTLKIPLDTIMPTAGFLGAKKVFAKPINYAELKATVKAMLAGK